MAFKCLGISRIMFMWGILQIMLNVVSSHQSIRKVFRIGDDLRLSCPSQDGSNQTWWFDGKSLDNNTLHTNETTILQIYNVIEKNQGIYWCGLSWQQGMNVTVLVGDLPSPPRNLYTTSYAFNKILHWKSANSTGGLPTQYSVHILCTNSCSNMNIASMKSSVLSNCDSIKHVDRKNYQCDLESADLFVEYRATVYAVNPLGNSSASIIFSRPNTLKPETTPSPPVQLNATEFQPGKVRLTWKSQDTILYFDSAYYRIVYREDDTNNNKTWPEDKTDKDTTVVIDNLNADTKYTFYVMKQFRSIFNHIPVYSPFSAPAIVTLTTKYAAPDQPPQDLRCSLMKDISSNVSFVEVSWKPPSKKHLNGPPGVYKILCSTLGSYNKTIMTVKASQTNVNLTFPKPHKRIEIFSKVCNKYGLCSGISNSCYVKDQPDSEILKKSDNSNKVAIIVGVVMGFICVAIIGFIAYCHFCRKKKNKENPDILDDITLDGPYADMYEEAENNVEEFHYDKPLL